MRLPSSACKATVHPTAPRGAPDKQRHHHHQQQIAVQDWAGSACRARSGVRASGHDLWQPCPAFPHPSLTVGRSVALSHVVVRATVAEVVEAAAVAMVAVGCMMRLGGEGWGRAEAGPAQLQLPESPSPSFLGGEQGQGPTGQ